MKIPLLLTGSPMLLISGQRFSRVSHGFPSLLVIAVLLPLAGAVAANPPVTPQYMRNDPPMFIFNPSSNLQITATESLVIEGKPPVDFAVVQFGFHGDKGYDYANILRPDLFPSGISAALAQNLFYENGEVKEQSAKDKSWVKYPCDKNTFLGWLDYHYNCAGIIIGMAQYALQHPANYTVTDRGNVNVFVPRLDTFPDQDTRQMAGMFKSMTFNKTPPILLQEMVMEDGADPGHPAVRFRFTYGVANFDGENAFNPPLLLFIKEVPNPLKDRMVFL